MYLFFINNHISIFIHTSRISGVPLKSALKQPTGRNINKSHKIRPSYTKNGRTRRITVRNTHVIDPKWLMHSSTTMNNQKQQAKNYYGQQLHNGIINRTTYNSKMRNAQKWIHRNYTRKLTRHELIIPEPNQFPANRLAWSARQANLAQRRQMHPRVQVNEEEYV